MRTWDQDEGDASVPTPHNPTPAPTNVKRLPRRRHEIPTRESATPPRPRPYGIGWAFLRVMPLGRPFILFYIFLFFHRATHLPNLLVKI